MTSFPGKSQLAPRQVVVMGMHHSGTSIVAKSLRDAGFFLGEDAELVWEKGNSLKYFERRDVNALNMDILRGTASTRSTGSRGPQWVHYGTNPWEHNLDKRLDLEIARIISHLDGADRTRLWATKVCSLRVKV